MKNIAIKENHLYTKTYKSGKRYVGACVAVYVLRDLKAKQISRAHPQRLMINRLGVTVTKKIGTAVVRNRAKRIIRAAYDSLRAELRCGNLIVISARGAIVGKKSTEVACELRSAFEKLGLLEAPNTERS